MISLKKRFGMKVLLIGWNENALRCMENIIESKHTLSCVITPDKYDNEDIKKICSKNKVKYVTVSSSGKLAKYIEKLAPDIVVSASWPWILKKDVFSLPLNRTINVHASLLPKNRGMHPLNWSIIRGESETGVTVHYIGSGVDDGDIILQEAFPIEITDDINSVKDKATVLGGEILVKALDLIEGGKVKRQKQVHSQVTLAPKRTPEDGLIDWNDTSRNIFNLIRALSEPYPNAFSYTETGDMVKISDSFVADKKGYVIAKYKKWFLVTTGDGVILVKSKNLKVGDKLKLCTAPVKLDT